MWLSQKRTDFKQLFFCFAARVQLKILLTVKILLHKCKQIPKLKEKKQDEQKDSENRMKGKRLVKKTHINNAAPIKTTTLTGEETTVLRKTGSRVERSFLLVRGTDR